MQHTVVYFAETKGLCRADILDPAMRSLPQRLYQRIASFRDIRDRAARTCAALLVLEGARAAGYADFSYDYAENGKPYCDIPGFFFNISHTREAAAVIFSPAAAGVDIELIRQPRSGVAERVCGTRELAYINGCGGICARRFCELWTKKEAILKRTGEGIRRCLRETDTFNPGPGIRLWHTETHGHALSCCLAAGPAEPVLHVLEIGGLLCKHA